MARYIGTITSDARGKVGGLIMGRGRSGTVLKSHAVPLRGTSPYQHKNRLALSASVSAWRALSGPNQQTWALVAANLTYLNSLGQPYSPTGLQLWSQAWLNAATVGTTPPASCSTSPPSIPPIVTCYINLVGFHIYVYVAGTTGPYAGNWSASCSSPLSASLNYTSGVRRRPMVGSVGNYNVDIAAPWEAAYGPQVTVGARVSVRVVPFDPSSFISGTPAVFVPTVT